MSHSSPGASHESPRPLNYASPASGEGSLVRLGGSLGVAASAVGLLIFVVGCFGFGAVFKVLPFVPLLLSVPGLVLSILGATIKRTPGDEDTHVMQALFVNAIGIIGALVELSVGLGWTMFYPSSGG